MFYLTIVPSLTETTGTFGMQVGLYDGTNPVVYFTFYLTIMANNAPTFANNLISVTFIQGADPYSFNIPNYIDPDGDNVIFTWV